MRRRGMVLPPVPLGLPLIEEGPGESEDDHYRRDGREGV